MKNCKGNENNDHATNVTEVHSNMRVYLTFLLLKGCFLNMPMTIEHLLHIGTLLVASTFNVKIVTSQSSNSVAGVAANPTARGDRGEHGFARLKLMAFPLSNTSVFWSQAHREFPKYLQTILSATPSPYDLNKHVFITLKPDVI